MVSAGSVGGSMRVGLVFIASLKSPSEAFPHDAQAADSPKGVLHFPHRQRRS